MAYARIPNSISVQSEPLIRESMSIIFLFNLNERNWLHIWQEPFSIIFDEGILALFSTSFILKNVFV